MSHKKRYRSAIAIILTLLLTAVLATAVSAQNGLPPAPGDPTDPAPTDPDPPEPGVTPAPTDPSTPPDPPDPPGNGMNGSDNGMMNGDDKDMMAGTPSSHSWPPPNAIVKHAATPIQISAHGGTLNVYIIAPDGAITSGPAIATISELAEMHPDGDAVSLFSGANAASGKSIMIHYLPAEMKIRVSTYYADKPPHDFNKPYVFTVDADHKVKHELW